MTIKKCSASKKYFVLVAILALWSPVSHAQTVKTMECTKFTKSGDPFREVLQRYRLEMKPSEGKLILERQSKNRRPIDRREWQVMHWSNNSNRVVAYATFKTKDNSLESPIEVLDADFGRPKLQFSTFGGPTDFDEIIFISSTIECNRLD